MFKNIIATTALLAASAALASAVTVTFNNSNTVPDATNYAAQNLAYGTYTVATGTLSNGETVTVSLTESVGYIYTAAATTFSDTAVSLLAEYDIDIDGRSITGIQGGQGQNTLTVTFSGLTEGETYTVIAIVGDLAGTASTISFTNGTLVSGTYYSATSDDSTGTSFSSSISATSAVYVVVAEVEADSDGEIAYSVTTKGSIYLTAIIPEPSAFGLLAGVGALALAASRRRRTRKA